MHLLATTTGVIDGGAEAIDLKQTPADVVILTAADSELACLAAAYDRLGESAPSLRENHWACERTPRPRHPDKWSHIGSLVRKVRYT